MPTFDGDTPQDKAVWYTYLSWARESATRHGPIRTGRALADDPKRRLCPEESDALQTILLSAFALEYRMKRVLKCINARCPKTLRPLVSGFWKYAAKHGRLDGGGSCAKPAEWTDIETELDELASLRDKIAHANYGEIVTFLSEANEPMARARRFYNAVINAIRLMNEGTGYDARPKADMAEYFEPLIIKEIDAS